MDIDTILRYPLPEWLPWALMALTVACVLWTLVWGLAPWRRVARAGLQENSGDGNPAADTEDSPAVGMETTDSPSDCVAVSGGGENAGASGGGAPFLSVIAYVGCDDVDDFVASMSDQDFDSYEIIIVNDAGAEATAELARRYASRNDVYVTFMPTESRNVSRLKTALTIGLKAAHGEAVLITSADVAVPSRRWLSLMAAPLMADSGIGVVLGAVRDEVSAFGMRRWWRSFESVTDACRWLGAALGGHPYRGDRRNLAFRRSLFFANKGYERTNHLQTGDDDLFVASVATGDNTAVVVDPDAMPEAVWHKDRNETWVSGRQRYHFTARWLPRHAFRLSATLRWMQWLAPLSGAVAAVCAMVAFMETSLPAMWTVIGVSVAAVLLMWVADTVCYRRAARVMGGPVLSASVVPFMLFSGPAHLWFRMRHPRHDPRNYTWGTPR